jgi:hypothetical protein
MKILYWQTRVLTSVKPLLNITRNPDHNLIVEVLPDKDFVSIIPDFCSQSIMDDLHGMYLSEKFRKFYDKRFVSHLTRIGTHPGYVRRVTSGD